MEWSSGKALSCAGKGCDFDSWCERSLSKLVHHMPNFLSCKGLFLNTKSASFLAKTWLVASCDLAIGLFCLKIPQKCA